MKTTIREALRGTPLFVPVRNAYFTLFNAGALNKVRSLKRFYAQFVRPGDLVFDVGANVGGHSEALASLGARVVAIEPNPECLKLLRNVRGIAVEPVAVGDQQGEVTLNISHSSVHSTISEEWKDLTHKKQDREWLRSIQVPVATLDSMVAKYGRPQFLKLDVEGYEYRALTGLRVAPSILCFEFFVPQLEATEKCLSLPLLAGARFNFVVEEDTTLRLNEWVGVAGLLRSLKRQPELAYGNVIARVVS